jgi:hypothetical protein
LETCGIFRCIPRKSCFSATPRIQCHFICCFRLRLEFHLILI